MEKKVSGAIVTSALPSPSNASLTATPIVATEGLNFMGVSISDWVYVAVFCFYFLSALHVVYKIWVRHKWVKQNLTDGVVKVSRIVNNSEVNARIDEARLKRLDRESKEDFINEK